MRRLLMALALVTAFAGPAMADNTPSPTPSVTPTVAPTVTPTGTPPPPSTPDPNRKLAIDQGSNLVNQVVRISWKGFTPSSDGILTDSTLNVVRVYQCRGKNPASVADCYGSGKYDYPAKAKGATVLPDGPTNAVTTITQANGTGFADIEIRTDRESASLGCKGHEDCSLVVIPNDGDPARPELHGQLATAANIDSTWAWANRLVLPISFAPAAGVCEIQDPDFTMNGSAPSRRLIEQWQPGLCRSKKKVDVDFTALSESQARASFSQKSSDVALTTLPDTEPAVRPMTYAPVTISGIAIAYRIDDADTGKAITDLKLTPRLVAKLLTESYGMNAVCSEGVKDCDKSVKGNPQDIFQDPEFLKLNGEDRSWPGAGWLTVVSGENDLAHELTRWLASDKDTRAFLGGAKAPGGMKMNTDFKGIKYPAASFEARDPDKRFIHGYIPVLRLSDVASYLVTNRDNSENYVKDQYGNYVKTAPYPVGSRGLIAIVSTADAAALRFPVARIKNAAGRFVGPTGPSMAAAVKHMKPNKDKITLAADFTAKDARAYPLTGVQYAEVPTNGIEKKKAQKIANFLAHAAGPGQKPGVSPGTKPVGYLPLTPAMRKQTKRAASEVLAQKGVLPPTPGVNTAPTTPTKPGPATQPVSLPVIAGVSAPMGGRLSADATALIGRLLPALLGIGLAAALLGPGLYGAGRIGPDRILAYRPSRPRFKGRTTKGRRRNS
jgi:hypothetical protein